MKGTCIAPTGAAATRFGETPAYAEGLHDLGGDVYAWMVPNGSWGETNAGLVAGAGEALLIDTLWDAPKTRAMLEAMRPVLDRAPLAKLVNTHADGDHFWGNQLVAGIDSLTSERALAEMAHHKPGAMRAFAALGRLLASLPSPDLRAAGEYFAGICAPYDFASVVHTPAKRGFTGALDLDIGGRPVRLIEVGPAHSQGDLVVHVPDARTLFAADIAFIGVTPVMWAGPLANWLKALDLILEMDVETIVPGHGPVTDKDGLAQVKAYWEFTERAARQHYAVGTTPAEAAFAIAASAAFREKPWAGWRAPERLMTNVHLLYREFAGETAPPGAAAKVNLMRKQALLARALSGAPDSGSEVD